MTDLFLREFTADDFVKIELSDTARANRLGQPTEQWGRYHEARGIAATAIAPDGQIVFIFGVHHRWSGCGELWATYAPIVARYPMALQYTRRLIHVLFEYHGYRRLQATVDPRFDAPVRGVKHLGFVYEGTLRCYGPHGEDHDLYALIREDSHG